MAGERLDQALVSRGLAESRSRARQLIETGHVTVDGTAITKPAAKVSESAEVALSGEQHNWASRAALKLVHGLDHFGVDPAGETCLDVGASTGGFTDVLLTRGAARVFALDVGHGQLVDRLRNDPRVTVLERFNVRDLTPETLGEPVGLVVSDVSFISLRLALPPALACARSGAHLVALVKPQFEAGRGAIGKGGIVRDPEVREKTVREIAEWLEGEMGWKVAGWTDSPISGGDGNQEFLISAKKP